MTDISRTFLEYSRVKLLHHYWPRTKQCVDTLSDEQLWWRQNEASNSVGNLLLHLNGNVRQWLVEPFGGARTVRDRSAEFSQRDPIDRAMLVARLDATVEQAGMVLARLTEGALAARYAIQGYDVTGFEAVYHVVEHFSTHFGQIVYVTKMLRGGDLGFYRGLDAAGVKPFAEADPPRNAP